MQREGDGRDNSNSSSSPFDRLRGVMSRIFGRKDPSDDPYATCSPENSSESSMLHHRTPPADSQPLARSNGPVIIELDTDDEGDVGREAEEDNCGVNGFGMSKEKDQTNAYNNANPLIEHPDGEPDDHNKSKSISKDVAHRLKAKKNEGAKAQTQNVSYRRVTYGGINGAYYTATTTRRTGSNGMVLEDSKQADLTTGQATHRISRGIHDKGHSLTRKLDSDGKVNSVQTLHNIEEDEIARFEQTWKGNADKHLPGWNNGFDLHANAGTSNHSLTNWNPGFGGGLRPNSNNQPEPSRGRPKKIWSIWRPSLEARVLWGRDLTGLRSRCSWTG
ncbi:uncharacterized protein LOC107793913 isoform X4 [Nicotiana tabacum]|uniref:Uncharacterized protein LOC107793913 isoform X4 n=1 Tax=Nicotiana tabacum TaxID=4097 RepID=A0AC58U062_TOBAC